VASSFVTHILTMTVISYSVIQQHCLYRAMCSQMAWS